MNAIAILSEKEAVGYFSAQSESTKQDMKTTLGGTFTWKGKSVKNRGSLRKEPSVAPPLAAANAPGTSAELSFGNSPSSSSSLFTAFSAHKWCVFVLSNNPGTSNTTFVIAYLGRGNRVHILRAKGPSETGEWLEKLKGAQKAYQEKSVIFHMAQLPVKIPSTFSENKVICGDVYDDGYVIGTDSGVFSCKASGLLVFLSYVNTASSQTLPLLVGEFVKISSLEKITQIRVNSKYNFVAVLGGRTSFSLPLLSPSTDPPPPPFNYTGKQQSLFTFSLNNLKKLIPLTKEDLLEVPDSSGTTLVKFGTLFGKDALAFIRSKADTVMRSVKFLELDAKKHVKKFTVRFLILYFIFPWESRQSSSFLFFFYFIMIEMCCSLPLQLPPLPCSGNRGCH